METTPPPIDPAIKDALCLGRALATAHHKAAKNRLDSARQALARQALNAAQAELDHASAERMLNALDLAGIEAALERLGV